MPAPSRELLRRIGVTVAVLVVYRFAAAIPLPTLNDGILALINKTGYTSIWQQFGGNPVHSISIVALGATPLVTAGLLLRLLSAVIAPLNRLAKSPEGKDRLARITRTTALVIAAAQAFATVGVYLRIRPMLGQTIDPSWTSQALTVAVLLGGFFLILLLSEIVTRFGVGAGTSVLLLATIASSVGPNLRHGLALVDGPARWWFVILSVTVFALAVAGLRGYQTLTAHSVEPGQLTARPHVTLRGHILAGGIAPIIFASTMLGLFATVGRAAGNGHVVTLLSGHGAAGAIIYALAVAGFSRLQTRMSLDPVTTANELVARGYFLDRTAPGWTTADRIAATGSCAAVGIALLVIPITVAPTLTADLTKGLTVLLPGTTMLLLASIGIDILRQLRAELPHRHRTPALGRPDISPDPWHDGSGTVPGDDGDAAGRAGTHHAAIGAAATRR